MMNFSNNSGTGKAFGVEPKRTLNRFSKKKLIPIAVINTEILGASLKGLYAILSIEYPNNPDSTIEKITAAKNGIPNEARQKNATNAPTIIISAWAKLISLSTPYTIV